MAKPKNSNAVKHGVYSEMILLPGEDREEFEALHKELREEWDPQGPSQEDKVFNIAQNMWRKGRSGRYRKERVQRVELFSRFQRNEIDDLITFLEGLEEGKPISELTLPVKWRPMFGKTCPRKNYDSDEAWRDAIETVVTVLIEELMIDLGNKTKEYVVDQFCDDKVIAAELALEERIDAKIDRDIVSLGKMKTMQAMGLGRRQGGPVIEHEPTKEIESPPVQPEPAGHELQKTDDKI